MNRIKKFFTDLKSSASATSTRAPQNATVGADGNITQWLTEDKKAIRIVLFGGRRSGKTTLCKQMKLLQLQNAFTEQERVLAVASIRQLIMESIREVAQAMVSADIHFAEEVKQVSLEYCSRELGELGCVNMTTFYEHVQTLYREELTTDYIVRLGDSRVSENITYFLDRLETVSMETYVPTDNDILRCRDKMSGNQRLKVPVTLSRSDLDFSILVPQTTDHLTTVLPHTQALLYTVDLHSFALDDPGHFLRSLELFQQLLSSRSFPNVHVILLLNKMDRLQEAVASGRSFERFVEGVDTGHPCAALLQAWSTWEGPTFEEQKAFLDSYPSWGDAEPPLDVHQRRASFRKKSSMLQSLMAKKGVQSETLHIAVFIRRLFVDMFTHTRQMTTMAKGRQMDEKPLSTYYTCLVDTYTTKRVFEAWRNTLLVGRV